MNVYLQDGLYNNYLGLDGADSFSLGLIFAELCVAMSGRIKYEVSFSSRVQHMSISIRKNASLQVFDDLREDRVHCVLSEDPELVSTLDVEKYAKTSGRLRYVHD